MSTDKDRLDRAFSIYIRKRDCRDGVGRCISCSRPITFSTCDAGHYIPRAHTATRWNTINVNAQCPECNQMMGGNIKAYRNALIAKYGIMAIEKIEAQRHTTVKMTKNSYKTLIELFKNQTNRL